MVVEPRTPTDYFEVALDLLAEGGPKAVTIAALCQQLEVTKGSFYHHFSGVPDFMRQLLGYWEQRGREAGEQAFEAADPLQRLTFAKLAGTYGLHHEAESAIRALARADLYADEVVRRVDQTREDQLAKGFEEAGIRQREARVLARIGIAILVGTQQRDRPVDRKRLQELFDEYQRWLEQTIADHVASN